MSTKLKSTVLEFPGHKNHVCCVSWSKDGKLASGSMDGAVKIWDVSSSKSIIEHSGHSKTVGALCWNPCDSNLLVSVSMDSQMIVFDIRSQRQAMKASIDAPYLYVDWRGDGAKIAACTKTDKIHVIDCQSGKTEHVIDQDDLAINELKWSRDGAYLYVTNSQGAVTLLNSLDYSVYRKISAHTGVVSTIAHSRDGNIFAMGGTDGFLSVWNRRELISFKNFAKFATIKSVSIAANNTFVASGGDSIDVDDVFSGENLFSIKTTNPVNHLEWHPTDSLLAYAMDESSGAKEWKVRLIKF